ncbi:MAG: transglycosylase SLT domain-containing protein [Pseudomonadota bacterium]
MKLTLRRNQQADSFNPVSSLRVAALCVALVFAVPAKTVANSHTAFEQRQLYRQAVDALSNGQRGTFRERRSQLNKYILAPYLTYHDLNSRLSGADTRSVERFLEQHAELPVSNILRSRWLKQLGRKRQWRTFLQHFPSAWLGRDAELFCYHLRARYNTGERDAALAQTATAWTQPESQPKACDPLFEVWQQSEHFTEEVAWQRLSLALAENEVTLARYLLRFFNTHEEAAEDFYQTHVRPQRLQQTRKYSRNTPKYRQIVIHSLPRLARRAPDTAARLWRSYRKAMDFSAAESAAIDADVALRLADEGQFPTREEANQLNSSQTAIDMAQLAVEQQNWAEVIHWVESMPDEIRAQHRWQYWLARALETATGEQERARLAYVSLAEDRQYYGFWAAHRLGTQGRVNADPVGPTRLQQAQLLRQAGFARSMELFAVGDDLNGRREWFAAVREVDPATQALAAQVALDNGLLHVAISTANIADAHDAVHIRFPLAFENSFRRASLKAALPRATLMAIARQESAMQPTARSHANARGLMQLLPSTARLVAKRQRLPTPSLSALYDPDTNITLGSSHLAWLKARYDGQLAPAIAAYNAGEHRVDRWIKGVAGMPLDVWIETIPFRETRNYVKNVLAFRYVYALRTDAALPFVANDLLRE